MKVLARSLEMIEMLMDLLQGSSLKVCLRPGWGSFGQSTLRFPSLQLWLQYRDLACMGGCLQAGK